MGLADPGHARPQQGVVTADGTGPDLPIAILSDSRDPQSSSPTTNESFHDLGGEPFSR